MTIVDKNKELEIETYKYRIRKNMEENNFRLKCVHAGGKKVEILFSVSYFNQNTLTRGLRIEYLHAPGLKSHGCNVRFDKKSQSFIGVPEEIVRNISYWLYEDENKLSCY